MLTQGVTQRPYSVLRCLSIVCFISTDIYIYNILDIHSGSHLGDSVRIFFLSSQDETEHGPLPPKRSHSLCIAESIELGVLSQITTTNKLPRLTSAQQFILFYRVKQNCKINHINQNLENCITLIHEFAMKNCQRIFAGLVTSFKIGFSLSTYLYNIFTIF